MGAKERVRPETAETIGMVNLLAPLGPLAVALGVMVGQPATAHPAGDTGRVAPARSPRCVAAHRGRRFAQVCRAPVKRHATREVSNPTRRKRGKHPTPSPPGPVAPGPTTPLGVAKPAAPQAPGDPTPPAPPTTPVASPPTAALPASVSAPSISGTPTVGSTLQASLGSWTNSPTTYSYHWSKCSSSCTGANGSAIAGTAGQLTYTPTAGDVGAVIYFVVSAENLGGQATAYSVATAAITASEASGALLYDGTFDSGRPNYPDVYGDCASMVNSTELEFDVTSNCNPGLDGHYRTDYATPNVYPAGVPECTSVPFDMTNMPTVPVNSWFQFAEAKDTAANLAGWGFGVTSYYGGVNQLLVEFNGYNNTAPAWTSAGGLPSGWNTLSICTNNANDSSGVVYGIWLNGVRQTFNHGPASGSQALSGFAIIDDGASSWPLDINDYTGGSPVSNQIIHGAPLVAAMDSSGLPPRPSGGWNSP
jgi:hypothetical protein